MSNRKLNILLLSETGIGKSTWINGFANYLKYSNLDEAECDETGIVSLIPTSFFVQDSAGTQRTVSSGTPDDNEVDAVGESSTQLPQTYVFSGRGLTVKMIDTPGIGDTRGLDKDRENVQFILNHIATFNELHGICILLKPNNARLTVMFTFVIRELLTHLHKSAVENILFCFTNTRSTFYRPGDTLPPLRELLTKDPEMKMTLSKDTIYCYDNEAVRYLFAVKGGVRLEDSERRQFADSYNKSVTEFDRMLQRIAILKPHPVKYTLTLNDARRMIILLQRPLAEMSNNIQLNIAAQQVEEEKLFAQRRDDVVDDSIQIPRIVSELIRLDHPRIICTKCNPGGEDPTIADCKSLKKTFFGKVSAIFGHPPPCRQCGCRLKVHMEMMYERRDVEVMENIAVTLMDNARIRDLDSSVRSVQSAIDALTRHLRELREEQMKVIDVSAKFACFLKRNSIAAYNDALDDYFQYMVELTKNKTPSAANLLENMKQVRATYQEETKKLIEAMSDPRSNVPPLTSNEIQKYIDDLYKLKNTGKMLADTVRVVEEAKKQSLKRKEVLFDANSKSSQPNALQQLFSSEPAV